MTYQEMAFDSGGSRAAAAGTSPARATRSTAGSGTTGRGDGARIRRHQGLRVSQPFAERFQAAGLDVLAFDYRGFGASEGKPRQTISIERQVEDYRAAIAAARALPGVDPNRIVLWGSSLSGGHVLRVAAGRDDVAAVIAMTPLTNSLATGRLVSRSTARGRRSGRRGPGCAAGSRGHAASRR